MSSFVISKIEYIKAAGLMYGLESKRKCPHTFFLENVKAKFEQLYRLNVLSVAEQYGDDPDTIGEDGCSYDSVFSTYKTRGKNIDEFELPTVKNGLFRFFESILYQIENPDMNKEASAFLYQCTSKLINICNERPEVSWWGKVSI